MMIFNRSCGIFPDSILVKIGGKTGILSHLCDSLGESFYQVEGLSVSNLKPPCGCSFKTKSGFGQLDANPKRYLPLRSRCCSFVPGFSRKCVLFHTCKSLLHYRWLDIQIQTEPWAQRRRKNEISKPRKFQKENNQVCCLF